MAARVVDGARLRGLVHAVAAVLGVLVVVDLGLRAAIGMDPELITRSDLFQNKTSRDEVAGRVSGVVVRRAAVPTDRPLAVIIGSSSARWGLEPSTIESTDPRHRWLNTAVLGVTSFDHLRYYAQPLFASPLTPDVFVVAMHPVLLAGGPAGAFLRASTSSQRTSWLLYHRERLNQIARVTLALAREQWLATAGLEFQTIHPPLADPWFEDAPIAPEVADPRVPPPGPPRWYEPASYANNDREIEGAVAFFADAQRLATRVVIVLMPESQRMRDAVPPGADASLRRVIERLSPPPVVIDFRAAVTQADMRDHFHLGPDGIAKLSAMLGERIAAPP